MTKEELITKIAEERQVEKMVANIAHQALTSDLCDLCQMVYLILLEYDESKLLDLYENGMIRFFLARVIVNQFRSSNSPFHITYRKFRERSVDISSAFETIEWSKETLIDFDYNGSIDNDQYQ